jgi:hypothetical protein
MKNKPSKTNVIVSDNIVPKPEAHEISAAWILAKHFNCVIEFIKPIDGYLRKTPDFIMLNLEWEIKSPKGQSRATVKHQLERASKQSKYIVFDGRRTKLFDDNLLHEIKNGLIERGSIKKIIFIGKDKKVVELSTHK